MAVQIRRSLMAWRARALGLLVGAAIGALGVAMVRQKIVQPPEIQLARRQPAEEESRGEPNDEQPVQRNRPGQPAGPVSTSSPSPPGPQETGVFVAPGVDAQRAMSQALAAHDPEMEERIGPLKAALFTPTSAACGVTLARRLRRAWMMNGVVAVDLELDGERAVVTGVHFPPTDAGSSLGDREFQACFSAAAVTATPAVSCHGCRPGRLTVPHPIRLKPYFPADDGAARSP